MILAGNYPFTVEGVGAATAIVVGLAWRDHRALKRDERAFQQWKRDYER